LFFQHSKLVLSNFKQRQTNIRTKNILNNYLTACVAIEEGAEAQDSRLWVEI